MFMSPPLAADFLIMTPFREYLKRVALYILLDFWGVVSLRGKGLVDIGSRSYETFACLESVGFGSSYSPCSSLLALSKANMELRNGGFISGCP